MYRTICLFVILAISMLPSGCATTTRNQNLGQGIQENHEVTSKYRALTIDPRYHYYYSGPKNQPNAIMGLDQKLVVQSKFWHQIDLTTEQLDYWVTWGDRQSSNEGFSSRYIGKYMGAYILDPEGKVVGDWYSKKDWGIFEFPGNNVIIPHPPRNQSGGDNFRRY